MNFDTDIAYLIGHAVAREFHTRKIVVVNRCAGHATKAVVGLNYVKALQVMKCMRVISTNGSNKKVIDYCALKDW